MFLTNEELFELTGYKNSARQKKWLLENGIKFLVGYDKKARVLISHIEDVMGNRHKANTRKTQPNMNALLSSMGLS